MARGAPDDSNIVKQGAVYRLDDMAELAARLGSPVTYHRFGDVIFMDQFESGVSGYTVGTTGTGGWVRVTNTYAHTGGLAVAMNTGTGMGVQVFMRRALPVPASYYRGFSFFLLITGGLQRIEIRQSHYTGSRHNNFIVTYQHTDGAVLVRGSDGADHQIGQIGPLQEAAQLFHIFKVTLDTNLMRYSRVFIDDEVFFAQDYGPVITVDTATPHIRAEIACFNVGPGPVILYVDNWVLTQNELEQLV